MSQRIVSTPTEIFFGAQTHLLTDLDRTLAFSFMTAMATAALVLLVLPAPYGKFHKSLDFVPLLSSKINWKWSFFISESPALVVPLAVSAYYWTYLDPLYLLFLALFTIHYVHRLVVYPFFRVRSRTPSTVVVAAASFVFQAVNSYLMSKFTIFIEFDPLTVPKIMGMFFGLCLFSLGGFVNIFCDHELISLRRSEEDTNYYLPRGILFHYVTCPNYLAEILQWTGMMVAYPSLASVCFVFGCCCNLVPRACSTHRFYQKKYGDRYPSKRKAIIPFVL